MAAKREFTQEEISFVRTAIQTMPTRAVAEAFTKRFPRPIGQTELRRMMARHGIQNPRKEPTSVPVGTERYNRYYDCMEVKVKDVSVSGIRDPKAIGKARNGMWKLKQNLVWEKEHGMELPWRWVVIFLDRNRMNYNPDNLYAVPLNVAGSIQKMGMASEDPEIYKSALIWGELYFLMMREAPIAMDRMKRM